MDYSHVIFTQSAALLSHLISKYSSPNDVMKHQAPEFTWKGDKDAAAPLKEPRNVPLTIPGKRSLSFQKGTNNMLFNLMN